MKLVHGRFSFCLLKTFLAGGVHWMALCKIWSFFLCQLKNARWLFSVSQYIYVGPYAEMKEKSQKLEIWIEFMNNHWFNIWPYGKIFLNYFYMEPLRFYCIVPGLVALSTKWLFLCPALIQDVRQHVRPYGKTNKYFPSETLLDWRQTTQITIGYSLSIFESFYVALGNPRCTPLQDNFNKRPNGKHIFTFFYHEVS